MTDNIPYNIITLTGDVPLNVYPFNNHFYITIDDFTQNHINDGVITTTKKETYIPLPSYSNKTSLVCNQETGDLNVSLYTTNYGTPNQLLTQNQLYAANQILMNNSMNATNSLYTSPAPNIRDMFAVIQLKLTGLQQGQNYVEIGGTLQDNNRIYFGGVNIRRLAIRLINDRGYLVDLNGRDWSLSLICTQLYSSNRV